MSIIIKVVILRIHRKRLLQPFELLGAVDAFRDDVDVERVRKRDERTYLLETAPDPAAGATRLALDPLELIHRLAQQIPGPR